MKKIFPFLISIMILGCSDSSPKLVTPLKENSEIASYGEGTITPDVDILFVVDDSGSMSAHQDQLATNIELFTKEIFKLKFIDFHIGVISTSMWGSGSKGSRGRLYGNPKFIDRTTPNPDDVLSEHIMLGTNGDSSEKMFDPVYAALTEPNLSRYNKGFYRDGANLVVIFLTDAEDQSDNIDDPSKMYDFLKTLKSGDASRLYAYGAIVPTDDIDSCERDDGSMKPYKIEKFIKMMGGSYYSLCDDDFGTKLANIGTDVATRISRYIYLERRPVLETIRVAFGSQVIPPSSTDGWVFEPDYNAIRLSTGIVWTPQPAGTKIQVTYKAAQ